MSLARGPYYSIVSMLLLVVCPVFARGISSLSNASAPTRACMCTHLLPLPETVVVLVESLPRGHVVLAVETREVGHAVHRVSSCIRGLRRLWRRSRVGRSGSQWAEGNVRNAAGDRGTHVGCEWSVLGCWGGGECAMGEWEMCLEVRVAATRARGQFR